MKDRYPVIIAAVIVACILALPVTATSQNKVPTKADKSMFRAGYDVPAGILHGTWDFDEWPGVDHDVMYKRNYMYNTFPNDKIKIDYTLSSFDANDHEGYLKNPKELRDHGFADMASLLKAGRGRKLLGIFAHPDDEVLLAGGLLAQAAALGWDVEVILLSNGADGSEGASDSPNQSLHGYNAFGVTREGKVMVNTDNAGIHKLTIIKDYAGVLGVSIQVLPISLDVAGRTVVQVGEAPGLDFEKTFGPGTDARREIRERLEAAITRERPALVFTHGSDGEYGNYIHRLIHDIVQSVAVDQSASSTTEYYTCFPEYNLRDKITHFLWLGENGGAMQKRKWEALKRITFLYRSGTDYDKPWDPNDDFMDGAFVKDYGYTPTDGMPPQYEFFQKVEL